jgi:hypothetical protein
MRTCTGVTTGQTPRKLLADRLTVIVAEATALRWSKHTERQAQRVLKQVCEAERVGHVISSIAAGSCGVHHRSPSMGF